MARAKKTTESKAQSAKKPAAAKKPRAKKAAAKAQPAAAKKIEPITNFGAIVKKDEIFSYEIEQGVYVDVQIIDVSQKLVSFKELQFIDDKKTPILETTIDKLEERLSPSTEKRFEMLADSCELAAAGRIKSLIITGQPGLGKTYTVENTLGDVPYTVIKGHCTPLHLYTTLYENSEGLIVFDDCDSILENKISGNILKAGLDTKKTRVISWRSAFAEKNGLPTEFTFNGTIIFISNKNPDKIDRAVISRSVLIDLHLNSDEIIERLNDVLENLETDLNLDDRKFVLNFMKKYRATLPELNIRSFKLLCDVYHDSDKNYDLLKYQAFKPISLM